MKFATSLAKWGFSSPERKLVRKFLINKMKRHIECQLSEDDEDVIFKMKNIFIKFLAEPKFISY